MILIKRNVERLLFNGKWNNFSYRCIMPRTSYIQWDELDFYSAISLKQQSCITLLTWWYNKCVPSMQCNSLTAIHLVCQESISLFPWQHPVQINLHVLWCRWNQPKYLSKKSVLSTFRNWYLGKLWNTIVDTLYLYVYGV